VTRIIARPAVTVVRVDTGAVTPRPHVTVIRAADARVIFGTANPQGAVPVHDLISKHSHSAMNVGDVLTAISADTFDFRPPGAPLDQAAHAVLIGPLSGTGPATFRPLDPSDVPVQDTALFSTLMLMGA